MAQIPLGDTNHPFNSNITTDTEEQLCQLQAMFGKDTLYSIEAYEMLRERLKNTYDAFKPTGYTIRSYYQMYMMELHIKILDMQICNYATVPNFAAGAVSTILTYLPRFEQEVPSTILP